MQNLYAVEIPWLLILNSSVRFRQQTWLKI